MSQAGPAPAAPRPRRGATARRLERLAALRTGRSADRPAGHRWVDETEVVAVDVSKRDRTAARVVRVDTRRADRAEVTERSIDTASRRRTDVEVEPLLGRLRH